MNDREKLLYMLQDTRDSIEAQEAVSLRTISYLFKLAHAEITELRNDKKELLEKNNQLRMGLDEPKSPPPETSPHPDQSSG